MIDLHSHILPKLDDGSASVEVSIEMARLAVADGITHMACTPHVMPGKYPNTSATIVPAIASLQAELNARQIRLTLLAGADVHVAWDLPDRLAAKEIPTLNGSRYFLLEPPHEILPPNLEKLVSRLINAGFIPIITHPERLVWVKNHYHVIERLYDMGCPLQLTAESLTGGFGSKARDYAIRMLEEGIVSLFASDAHGVDWRRPVLSVAKAQVATQWDESLAEDLFVTRPRIIASDGVLPRPAKRRQAASDSARKEKEPYNGLLRRMLGKR